MTSTTSVFVARRKEVKGQIVAIAMAPPYAFLPHCVCPIEPRGVQNMRKGFLTCLCCAAVSAGSLLLVSTGPTPTVNALGGGATDPGVRSGATNAGAPLPGL